MAEPYTWLMLLLAGSEWGGQDDFHQVPAGGECAAFAYILSRSWGDK